MSPESQGPQIGKALNDVAELSQKIVREEIELAKAEVAEKATKLGKGAAVGAAAGIFAVFGLIYLLQALSWFLWKVTQPPGSDEFWIGFLIVAVGIFLLAGLAGFLAYRWVKGGAPPTPQMAIDEAKLVQETVTTARTAELDRPA